MAVFSNQATLTYNGGSTVSNVVTGEILEVLSVTKRAVTSSYRPYDTVTYVISLVNSGSSDSKELTLSDDLGAYPFGEQTLVPATFVEGSLLYYVNGSEQPSPTVTAGPPLVITGITVPAGGSATVIYSVKLNEYAPLGADECIRNTVTVTGECITEPLTANEIICTVSESVLSICKSLSPTSVVECGQITYTFVIENSGNKDAVATDNLSVSDTFTPHLTDIVVTLDGETLTEGTDYTYDEATGVFKTQPGRITVPKATITQDPDTGAYTLTAGSVTLIVTGKI